MQRYNAQAMAQATAAALESSAGPGAGAMDGSGHESRPRLAPIRNMPTDPVLLHTMAHAPPVFVYCAIFQQFGPAFGQVHGGPLSTQEYESAFLQGLLMRLEGEKYVILVTVHKILLYIEWLVLVLVIDVYVLHTQPSARYTFAIDV